MACVHLLLLAIFQSILCKLGTMCEPAAPWAPEAKQAFPGRLAGSLVCNLKSCFLTRVITCFYLVQSIWIERKLFE